ncbi:anthranilate synthase component I [Natroniella acetigena]|uniref:anthranilate synthase component I n=1 Tax=Natroniella acetigena TaxID=52004 RepID=UPI00200A744F|nr:anthranilate synthase component I [Natroniella acetigena]MCK8828101.1 anthranilate synthase component I [Natroniella acetigena]
MYYPSYQKFEKLSRQGELIPVYREITADLETPVSAFKKISAEKNSYLLESVEQGENLGRYSFIGVDYHALLSCQDGQLIIKDQSDQIIERKKTENPVEELQAILESYQAVQLEELPMFYGGAVGYLGYDAVSYFEDIPMETENDLELPEMLFILSDTVLVFDHLYHKIKVVTNVKVSDDAGLAYQRAKSKIDQIIKKLQQPIAIEQQQLKANDKKLEFESNLEKEQFIANVKQAKDYIKAGDIFQVVLSQRLEMEVESEGFDIYRQLRRVNPSPYMYYLDFEELELIGSSPELLVRVEDGLIENRPIAGTRKRGKDVTEDQALAKELLSDEKEKAEHVMLVDLGRNDVGRVSKYSKVDVTQFMEVEYYSHVMHLVSNVRGELREDEDIYSALQACFPAGTVSGAPKIRAMEIIEQLETTRRGPYAGSIGYFGYSGNLDSCITIRTILLKDNKAYVQAGAGIVADSDPEAEYQETLNKARALLKAVYQAERGGAYGVGN